MERGRGVMRELAEELGLWVERVCCVLGALLGGAAAAVLVAYVLGCMWENACRDEEYPYTGFAPDCPVWQE